MKLGIYSLRNILFQGEVVSINCRTESGEITILDHHRPLISILNKGTVKVTDGQKKEHYIPVGSGFLEVKSSNEVKFLVEENI
jgi:F0F1-type ATP synthase epsilon subunit